MGEKEIETCLVRGVKDLGGKAFKFVSPGNNGIPDRLVILPGGRVLFAELKARNGILSKMQEYQIAELRRLGAEVWEVWGINDADNFLSRCRDIISGGSI